MIKRKAPIEGALKSSIQFYFGAGDRVKGDEADVEDGDEFEFKFIEGNYDFLKDKT
jgi:hypothetical protein